MASGSMLAAGEGSARPMLRKTLAPIHPDGWKFIAGAALATVILFLVWRPAGWAGLTLTLWMAYFFPRSLARDADPSRADRQPGRWDRGLAGAGIAAARARDGRDPGAADRHLPQFVRCPYRARAARRQGRGAALHQGAVRQRQPRQGEPRQRASGDQRRPRRSARDRLRVDRRAGGAAHRLPGL